MPAIAQGISKQTVFKKQTALGTYASGSGGQILRRRNSVFTLDKDRYESDEIVSHQQSTGSTGGVRATSGKLDGLLSAGTYKALFQSLLRRDFTTGATAGAQVDVTAAVTVSPAGTFTDASAAWISAGFKVGDVVRFTGFAGGSATNNNNHNFLITSLTSSVMTVYPLDGQPVVADAAGDSVTCTVVGKKTYAPTTGHTKDYYTFEEYYGDISPVVSERYGDVMVAKADITMPATGNIQVAFDLPGLSRSVTGAQVLTSPTAETTSDILTAVQGVLVVNGTVQAIVTGLNISIDGTNAKVGPVVGSNSNPDQSRGRIKVTGQFSALFSDSTFMSLYDAETPISLMVAVTDSTSPTAEFVTLIINRLKLSGDAPDDGEKGIERTYPFIAEINDVASGAGTAYDTTIIAMQDSLA